MQEQGSSIQPELFEQIEKFGTVSIDFFDKSNFVKCVDALVGVLNFSANWHGYGVITLKHGFYNELQYIIPFWRFGVKFGGNCNFYLDSKADKSYGDGFTTEVSLVEPDNFVIGNTIWVEGGG